MKQQFVTNILGFRVPESVARLTRAQLIYNVHGVEVGKWKCPHCEHLLQEDDYPVAVCCDCHNQTIPRRCNTKGCTEICHPIVYRNEQGKTQYYDPPMLCERCHKNKGRMQRAEWCERVIPKDVYSGAMAYERTRHGRESLDAFMAWWVSEDKMGQGSNSKTVYVFGKHGSGKSVGVMAHVMRGHVAGMINAFWYVTQADIDTMARGTYSDNTEERRMSSNSFSKCATSELLILDSAGDRAQMQPSVRTAYERILSGRISNMQPTIVISTRHPANDGSCFRWISESVASQFTTTGATVEVN
tara:strand:+ start:320 stop:1222 length:903 start_codon:yes stop_codon:yes gene_type:complete